MIKMKKILRILSKLLLLIIKIIFNLKSKILIFFKKFNLKKKKNKKF